MHIETERLILRPWREEDAESLYEYAKDPDVGPAAGWQPHTSVENSRELIRDVLSDPINSAVMLKETGKAIGSVGVMRQGNGTAPVQADEAELGFWIGKPYWGQGLIPEAVRALLEYCFVELNCSRVWCGYYEGNEKSKRVQEKCGFMPHHREDNKPCVKMGDVRTEYFTHMTRESWLEIRKRAMTNHQIFQIALQQSAYDCNCSPEAFLSPEGSVHISAANPKARKYLSLPAPCSLVSYGNGIVAHTSERLADAIGAYIRSYPAEHAFETPHIYALNEALEKHGLKVCFMAEYFLPDVDRLRPLECAYELRVLHQEDFAGLYLPEWSNALCEKRRELDVIGVGAYDGGKLVGLAGASADCESMYQIGVDVLPAYRKRGIASALTSRLALEILALGKVPFYCAAWCNVRSVRNAVRCGFRPAWVELQADMTERVDAMNRRDEG